MFDLSIVNEENGELIRPEHYEFSGHLSIVSPINLNCLTGGISILSDQGKYANI